MQPAYLIIRLSSLQLWATAADLPTVPDEPVADPDAG
jgi:hypothetical protein